jgi:ketosteroid isomerase-like protein
MKIIPLLFFFLVPCFLIAQNADEQAIRRMMDEQAVAWNQGNIEGFMQGYWQSEELTFIGKNGPTKGWNATLQNYKRSYSDASLMGRLNFDQLSFLKLGKNCYKVTGAWHLQRESPVGGWFTLIVKKIKKEWKIIYDHTS